MAPAASAAATVVPQAIAKATRARRSSSRPRLPARATASAAPGNAGAMYGASLVAKSEKRTTGTSAQASTKRSVGSASRRRPRGRRRHSASNTTGVQGKRPRTHARSRNATSLVMSCAAAVHAAFELRRASIRCTPGSRTATSAYHGTPIARKSRSPSATPPSGTRARRPVQVAHAPQIAATTSSAMGPFASIDAPSSASAPAMRALERRVAASWSSHSAGVTNASWNRSVASPRERPNGRAMPSSASGATLPSVRPRCVARRRTRRAPSRRARAAARRVRSPRSFRTSAKPSAADQYASGGLSRCGAPPRCGTLHDPPSCISRAIAR